MTNKTPKHSPLPWKMREDENCVIELKTHCYHLDIGIFDKNDFCASDKLKNKVPYDVEFIIRSVNSHYQILEALKELIEILEDYSDNPGEDEELVRAKLAVDNAMNGKSGYTFEKMD